MDKYLLWHLLAGTRGGINRIRIIKTLQEKPQNANQLSESLRMDYKTIRHHLAVLTKNHIISTPQQDRYGGMYFLTSTFEALLPIFNEIWEKLNKHWKIRKPKRT